MQNNLPFISIVIPCRNERDFIIKCIDSISSNSYPQNRMEVLIIDGMSDDGTREIVRENIAKYSFVKLIDNPQKITPAAFNAGIKNAAGEIVMIMSAHAVYKDDYISKCVEYLQQHDEISNVGGICITLPGSDSVVANAVALALSSPFGVGNSYFRIGSQKQRYVDTVPFGCYRKSIFDKIGLFDEDLIRTQDSEFNARVIKNGGKILLVPEIVSYYYARTSLSSLLKMQFQYGYFKPLAAKKIGKIFAVRHMVPPLFIAVLVLSLVLGLFHTVFLWLFLFIFLFYALVNLIASLRVSLLNGFKYFFVLPAVFFIIHFGWGGGFLKGIWDFIIFGKYNKTIIKNMPLTR